MCYLTSVCRVKLSPLPGGRAFGKIIAVLRFSATAFLAVLATVIVTAASPTAVLDWPYGQTSQLPSPDGRHILYGEPYQPGIREGPELWLRHREPSSQQRVLELGSTARAFWFPDSRDFVVIDRESSSGATSYIYNMNGHAILDMRAALLQNDPELVALARGHFYVEAQRLLGSDRVRVAAFGHTDEPPVLCFRLIYTVSRGGEIKRLSKRISPATATACDETSE